MSEKCANCGSDDFTVCYQRGDYICTTCGGCSPNKMFDETQEKRNFLDGPDHSRGSCVDFYLQFSGVTTTIGKRGGKKSNTLKGSTRGGGGGEGEGGGGGGGTLQRTQNQMITSTMSITQQRMSKSFTKIKKYQHLFSLQGLNLS